jgi:hypothetical protein
MQPGQSPRQLDLYHEDILICQVTTTEAQRDRVPLESERHAGPVCIHVILRCNYDRLSRVNKRMAHDL